MGAKRLRDAGAELVGLNQQRDQRLDVVDLSSGGEILEGFHARLAGSNLGGNQPQLIGERGIGQAELVGSLDNRLVEARSGFDANDEQVERIGKPLADLSFPPLGQPAEYETRKQVANRRQNERENKSLPETKERQGNERERDRAHNGRGAVNQHGGHAGVPSAREPTTEAAHFL